jgi:hypothetical protein
MSRLAKIGVRVYPAPIELLYRSALECLQHLRKQHA